MALNYLLNWSEKQVAVNARGKGTEFGYVLLDVLSIQVI